MSLDAISKGDYGYTIELTVKDVDTDNAADISSYSTNQYIVLQDPDGNESEKSATFKTDGSDGVVQYTVQSSDIDAGGWWAIRVKVEGGSATLRSEWKSFEVNP